MSTNNQPKLKTVKIPIDLYNKIAAHAKNNLEQPVNEVATKIMELGVQTLDHTLAVKYLVGQEIWVSK